MKVIYRHILLRLFFFICCRGWGQEKLTSEEQGADPCLYIIETFCSLSPARSLEMNAGKQLGGVRHSYCPNSRCCLDSHDCGVNHFQMSAWGFLSFWVWDPKSRDQCLIEKILENWLMSECLNE